MTDDDIIAAILRRENGFVWRSNDKGGPTNHGITAKTLADWRGQPVAVADVQRLTVAEAIAIYRKRYIEAPGFGRIADADLRALVVDCAVNSGPIAAIRWLQAAVGVTADGVFGPATEAAVAHLDSRAVRARVTANRARFYGRLITSDPTQSEFAAGWLARLAEFIEALA